MSACPTCLLAVERCAACGEALDAAGCVGLWLAASHTRNKLYATRQHRHYHPDCAPRAGAQSGARPVGDVCPRCGGPKTAKARQCIGCRHAEQRGMAGPSKAGGSCAGLPLVTDRCDVCRRRLPVAELAYRTQPPRRSGGTETLLAGHGACLDRKAGGDA